MKGYRRDGAHVIVGTPNPLAENFAPSGREPEYICDDTSQAYAHDPEKLKEIRSKRPTDKRIERVEDRLDKLEPAVARMEGKVDLLVQLAEAREQRWKHFAPIIKAVGLAVALVVAAYFGHGMFK